MPVGFRIASAWVDIRAEGKGLKEQIKGIVEKAARGQEAKIQLKIDSKGLRKEVQDALKAATAKQKPLVDIGIRSTGLRREVSEALKRATSTQKPTVKLSISSIGLRSEVQRALTAATAGQSGTVHVNADVDTGALQRALAGANPTIRPDVDVRHMRSTLMAAIRNINQNDDIVLNPDIDGDLLRARITSEVARLRDRFRVRIHPDVNVSEFQAKIAAAARSVRGGDVALDFNPRINELKLRAATAAAAARIKGQITFNGDLDTAMLAAKVAVASRSLNALGRNLNFRGKVDIDSAAAMAKLARIRAEMMALNTLVNNGGHSFSRLGKIIVAALALGPPAIAAFLPALQVTMTASMGLVAVFSELSLVFATVAVGGNGVLNAIEQSTKGAKQFAEAMNKLTPTAQRFVEAIITQRGAFHSLQQSVQDIMFSGLDKSFRTMADTIIPDLNIGLGGMADQLNGMAKQTMGTVESLSRMGLLKTMFGGLLLAFKPLVPMPGQFLNMLTKLTIAGTPLLMRMTSAFGRGVDSLNEKVNTLFESGMLQAKITQAGDTIVNFFKRIGNNPEWTKFISDLKANAPQMAQLLGDITNGAMHLLNALHPISAVLVGVIAGFSKLINAIPTSVLTFFIAKLILLKVATTAVVWIMGLTRGLAALKLALVAINSQAAMTAILQMSTALSILGVRGRGLSLLATAIRGVGKAAIALGVLWAGKEIIDHFANSATGAAPDVDKLQLALRNLSNTGNFGGELKKAFGNIQGLAEGFKTLNAGIKENIGGWESLMGNTAVSDWTRGVIDNFKNGEKSIDGWNKKMGSLDEAMTSLVQSGNGDIAANFIKRTGISAADSKKYLDGYNKSLVAQKLAQSLAADSMGAYGQEALRVQTQLNAQKAAADGLKQSIQALSAAHRLAAGGQIAMEQAIDSATEGIIANGAGMDVNTKKGQDNRNLLLTLAQTTEDYAAAKLEETGSYAEASKAYDRGSAQFIKLAQDAGLTKAAAKALADQWLKMPDKKFMMDADATNLDLAIGKAQDKVDGLKQKKKTAVGADIGKVDAALKKAQAELDALKQKRAVPINAEIVKLDAAIKTAQGEVDSLTQKKATAVGANKTKFDEALQAAQKKLDDLKQKKAAAIEARDGTGPGVASAKRNIGSVTGKTVTITTVNKFVTTGSSSKVAPAKRDYAVGGLIRRASGGMIPGFPSGGSVKGPGTGTSDSIMAMVSNGEYVLRAAVVKKLGPDFLNALNSGQLPGYSVGGYTKKRTVGKGSSKKTQYYYQGQWLSKEQYDTAHGAAQQLEGDTTFSYFGKMAAAQGSFKHNEMENNLGNPADIGSLVNSLNGYRSQIKTSTSGKTEAALLKKLDSSGKSLLANQKKLDGVNASLDKAKTNLDSLKSAFDSLKESVKSNIIDTGNVTKVGKYGTSVSTLINQLQTDTNKAGQFESMLSQLKAKGLNGQAISDIAEAGVNGGGMATAQTLLGASAEDIKKINELQAQLTASATKAGDTVAQSMYGAGIKAAEGLVAGLTSQQKAIENTMMAIAKSMEAAIKKALGIKSPSRVMMRVADFTADGLVNQLGVRTSEVHAKMRDLAMVPNSPMTAPSTPMGSTGTINTGLRGQVTNVGVINVSVSGNFSLNSAAERRALAKTLAKDIKEELRKDDKAHR